MLLLKKIIAEGMVRECYFHPEDEQRCVKVVKDKREIRSLQRELQIYNKVKDGLAPFICHYDGQLVETDKGPGLVMELVRDDDGQVSKKLSAFLERQSIDEGVEKQLDIFFKKLLDERWYFTDFNLDNFLIVRRKEQLIVKYIDLKSYRSTKSFIRLEVFLPFLWRSKTIRRMRRLYQRLGLCPYLLKKGISL
ncbi:MAG: hypothetical protein CSA20_01070 [Deltaproteobacteria bacterium]|nr:MAG: hypothetical protein CSA20_01070 [Deltaproteobacteria bacterium]